MRTASHAALRFGMSVWRSFSLGRLMMADRENRPIVSDSCRSLAKFESPKSSFEIKSEKF
jgi:hypothetical protein